jgi:Zn-dependent protease with chaperone function
VFDLQIARIGEQLVLAAFGRYPELRGRLPQFEFVIADKSEAGTTSNDSGTVIIFRGTQLLGLSEDALAFVIAREMGHVISGHHSENTAIRVIISVVSQILMPVANLLHSLALLPSAFAAAISSAASSAASFTGAAALNASAASLVGSRLVIASYKPEQLTEADTVAANLLPFLGYSTERVAEGLAALEKDLKESDWTRDLRASSALVRRFAADMRREAALPAPSADADSRNLGGAEGEPVASREGDPIAERLECRSTFTC